VFRRILISLFSLLLMPASLAAQSDIQITAIGPIRDVARNATWGQSGAGGIDNNFIFSPTYTNEGVCMTIASGPNTGSGAYTINFFGTSDQTVKTYAGNTAAWSVIGPVSGVPPGVDELSIQNLATNLFVQVSGMARVAIVIRGGHNGPVTVTMVESQGNGTGCGNVQTAAIYCPYSGTATVNASSTLQIVPNFAGLRIYFCNFQVSEDTDPTSGQANILEDANQGSNNCSNAPQTVYTFQIGPAEPESTFTPVLYVAVGQPLVGGFTDLADLVGDEACIQNTTTTAFTANWTYAQF
jgi:hypothetical protein